MIYTNPLRKESSKQYMNKKGQKQVHVLSAHYVLGTVLLLYLHHFLY